MKIYPVTKSNNLVDVFLGDGWETWGRYKRVAKKWVYIKGIRLSEDLLKALTKETSKLSEGK